MSGVKTMVLDANPNKLFLPTVENVRSTATGHRVPLGQESIRHVDSGLLKTSRPCSNNNNSRRVESNIHASVRECLTKLCGDGLGTAGILSDNGYGTPPATRLIILCVVLLAVPFVRALGQTVAATDSFSRIPATDTKPPLILTLNDAVRRARANNPQLQAAFTALGLAHQDLVQSRAALLPNVSYNMQFLYTEPSPHDTKNPIFIANNGIHEYIAQGNVHQALSLQTFADYGRASAARAVARAKSEIALRGLAVTVAQAYYAHVAAGHKYATAQRANEEAQRFLGISEKLENGGEVAHSDVIKAQLQYRQQQRDLREAELGMNKTRLDLAVLIFKDFNENFTVVDDLGAAQALPTFDEVSAAGTRNNPDLRAAQAALRQASRQVTSAWGGVLPSITVDYWYGIDANQFATEGPTGLRNLGSAAAATLQLPIWSWGANFSKVKQANLQRNQAVVELSAAQRTLLANLRSFYNEAQAAHAELELLSQTVQLASESLRLTSLRYQSGEATVLEVVDAQNTLTAASNADDDGQVRFRIATANLQTLIGKF
jgi:outer membrane protein TolC